MGIVSLGFETGAEMEGFLFGRGIGIAVTLPDETFLRGSGSAGFRGSAGRALTDDSTAGAGGSGEMAAEVVAD